MKKQVKQVAVHAKRKKYFVSITYEEDEKPYVDNGKYQAIDLGVANIVTAENSAGKFLVIRNQRLGKYWDSRITGLQSRRDRCIEYSNRWKHPDGIMSKYQTKCADQTKDFQHKLSKRLVENTKANTIIVGDLEVKKMAQSTKVPKSMRKGLNRATQNNGTMGRFEHFLTYKCKRVGKRTIEIDERNSTKECYICGTIHHMKLWNRIMDCDCGNVIDRDKNGAINIMKR
ncbi:MAG: RNA-guided endonuclease InsQ/TnpB family protein, partial [Candidatus Hodarchaeota archaeon]